MNLQQAIDAPSWHINHFVQSFWPRTVDCNKLTLESRFSAGTIEGLKKRGHGVVVGEPWSEGRLSACAKDGELLRAAANPRGMQGYAAGR
jgi:gamma-glutamyltranspeptidase/glutathione hydrolase